MTLPIRKTIFWLHLAAGVLAGVVILLMSVTGVALTYERQMLAWAERGYLSQLRDGEEPLSIETLLDRVQDGEPEAAPSAVTLRSDLRAPASVSFGRGRSVFVDRYSGRVLGAGSPSARAFFRKVREWHRWMGMRGENRDRARAVTGACNLLFLFLVASGIVLWWPRNGSPASLRNVVWFRSGLSGKARDFNWHNTIGLWSAIPLAVVVFSGVFISYPWATSLLDRALGSDPPAQGRPGPGERERERERAFGQEAPSPALGGLDESWAAAAARFPDWKSLTVRIPAGGDEPWSFDVDRGNGARPDRRNRLVVDRLTGRIVEEQSASAQELPRRVRSWMRWLHTGEAFGFVGQTVAGIASANGALLVWTGLALAWRRFFPKR